MAPGAVRVVGGEFGGRRLTVPKDSMVRPTADRVREAWMSILGEELRVPGCSISSPAAARWGWRPSPAAPPRRPSWS